MRHALLPLLACVVGRVPGDVRGTGILTPLVPVIHEPPSFEVWIGGCERAGGGCAQESPSFPLVSTAVQATVTNGILYAKVQQEYRNDGPSCLQSRYVFPMPHRAAISGMEMQLGNRTVRGIIRAKEDAREEFEAAQRAGQQASLLDQHRPNVFSMELANILPGETTRVTVSYTEALAPTDGRYAFVFPTVVAPRFVSPGADSWEGSSGDSSSLVTTVTLRIQPAAVSVSSSVGLELEQTVELNATTVATTASEDCVIEFELTSEAVQASMWLGQKDAQGYFLLAVQPPLKALLPYEGVSTREYLFILDVSGSMSGYPIGLSRELIDSMLREQVRPGDSMNILLFAGGSAVYSDTPVLCTADEVQRASQWLDTNMQAGGGTELLPALQRAFDLPRRLGGEATARTIIVMTDGEVAVERAAFELVRSRAADANVFTLGIGDSVNRYIIDGLARAGSGEAFVATGRTDGAVAVTKLQAYIDAPLLTRLDLSFNGEFHPSDMQPPALPDVFASRPVLVVGKWSGSLTGTVSLSGYAADGSRWSWSEDVADLAPADRANPSIPLLWGRSRIAVLSDYQRVDSADSEHEAIEAIGLEFGLMTEFTSFVAVDSADGAANTCAPEGQVTWPDIPLEDTYGHGYGAGLFSSYLEDNTAPGIIPVIAVVVVITVYAACKCCGSNDETEAGAAGSGGTDEEQKLAVEQRLAKVKGALAEENP